MRSGSTATWSLHWAETALPRRNTDLRAETPISARSYPLVWCTPLLVRPSDRRGRLPRRPRRSITAYQVVSMGETTTPAPL